MLGYQFKAHPLASGVSLRESLCQLVKLLRSPAFAGRRSFVVVKGMEEWVEGVFFANSHEGEVGGSFSSAYRQPYTWCGVS